MLWNITELEKEVNRLRWLFIMLNKLKNEHPKIHKETANIITFILFKFKEKNSFYNVFEYAQNVMNYQYN